MRKNKKLRIILLVVAIVAVAAIGVGIYAYCYRNQDHTGNLSEKELYEFNYVLTVFGRNAGVTGNKEVLIVKNVEKALGADTQVSFVIYQYTNESDLNAAMQLTAEEIAMDSRFTYVGSGTVAMENDSFAGMKNMKTSYIR